jgi:hypothetical protein
VAKISHFPIPNDPSTFDARDAADRYFVAKRCPDWTDQDVPTAANH